MRLLVYNKVVGDLNNLGFEADDLACFKRHIERPYGLMLTTGPTGSGKTTTLYSALMTINSPNINCMTVEDPIEYAIPTIRQTAVNPKAGLSFENALRSAMRQDPDVILVGEIRDKVTADLAMQAALTGHLVLSTLHTNDAASAINRLLDLGVNTSILASTLSIVLAQRLMAAIYPTFIILAIVAVIGVWVGYVLPQMAGLLTEMGAALPYVTQMVLDLSYFVQKYWLWMLGGALITGLITYLYTKTPRGLIRFHKVSLKIPLFGEILNNIAIARLSHNFATMYTAGMNINTIFDILSDRIIGNRYLEQQLTVAFEDIQRGESISDAIQATKSFPTLLIGAIRNGETTGTIDDAFRRLGAYYDKEVKRNVETMINALEPLSIIILGGIFGLIALSIMLPLYDMIAEIQ
jgi:type II secretory pathway component PulF